MLLKQTLQTLQCRLISKEVCDRWEKSDINTNLCLSLLSTFLALSVLQTESKKNNKKELCL